MVRAREHSNLRAASGTINLFSSKITRVSSNHLYLPRLGKVNNFSTYKCESGSVLLLTDKKHQTRLSLGNVIDIYFTAKLERSQVRLKLLCLILISEYWSYHIHDLLTNTSEVERSGRVPGRIIISYRR